MLDQTLEVLSNQPNIDAVYLAKAALDIDIQDIGFHNEARRFRRMLSSAVQDKIIVCDHVRDGRSLKVTYRLSADEAPENVVKAGDRAEVAAKRSTPKYPSRKTEDQVDDLSVRWGNTAVPPPAAPDPAVITTVTQLEQIVEQERKPNLLAIRKQLEQQTKVLRGTKEPVVDLALKLEVVGQLAELFSDDISVVLNGVADDLGRLADIVGADG